MARIEENTLDYKIDALSKRVVEFLYAYSYIIIGAFGLVFTMSYIGGNFDALYMYDKSLVATDTNAYWATQGQGFAMFKMTGLMFKCIGDGEIGYALMYLLNLILLTILPFVAIIAVYFARLADLGNYGIRVIMLGVLVALGLLGYFAFQANGYYTLSGIIVFIIMIYLAVEIASALFRGLLLVIHDDDSIQ